MSGFSQHWLRLREAADHRCRAEFAATAGSDRQSCWTIADLGCGTGSNLRFVMPRIERAQEWICIDNDPKLLAALIAETRGLVTPDRSITTRQLDLAGDIGATLGAVFADGRAGCGRLVTASALLDLVSGAWIENLATACTNAGAFAWFALSYDGRIELAPRHAEDSRLQLMINAHQRTDKGFGAALGPHAHAAACTAFARHGYEIREVRSDWHLTAGDRDLQRELIEGWLSAARELANDEPALRDWSALRRSQIDAGVLEIRVGHGDLLAVPRASAQARQN